MGDGEVCSKSAASGPNQGVGPAGFHISGCFINALDALRGMTLPILALGWDLFYVAWTDKAEMEISGYKCVRMSISAANLCERIFSPTVMALEACLWKHAKRPAQARPTRTAKGGVPHGSATHPRRDENPIPPPDQGRGEPALRSATDERVRWGSPESSIFRAEN